MGNLHCFQTLHPVKAKISDNNNNGTPCIYIVKKSLNLVTNVSAKKKKKKE